GRDEQTLLQIAPAVAAELHVAEAVEVVAVVGEDPLTPGERLLSEADDRERRAILHEQLPEVDDGEPRVVDVQGLGRHDGEIGPARRLTAPDDLVDDRVLGPCRRPTTIDEVDAGDQLELVAHLEDGTPADPSVGEAAFVVPVAEAV